MPVTAASYEEEFSCVLETLEGAYGDKLRGEDRRFKEGYRGALAFAIELVNRRLGSFAPKEQSKLWLSVSERGGKLD